MARPVGWLWGYPRTWRSMGRSSKVVVHGPSTEPGRPGGPGREACGAWAGGAGQRGAGRAPVGSARAARSRSSASTASPSPSSRTSRTSPSSGIDEPPGAAVQPADVPAPLPRLEPLVDPEDLDSPRRAHRRSRSTAAPRAIAVAAGEPDDEQDRLSNVRWRIPSGRDDVPVEHRPGAASGWSVSRPAAVAISSRTTRPADPSRRGPTGGLTSRVATSRQRRPRRPSATTRRRPRRPAASPDRPGAAAADAGSRSASTTSAVTPPVRCRCGRPRGGRLELARRARARPARGRGRRRRGTRRRPSRARGPGRAARRRRTARRGRCRPRAWRGRAASSVRSASRP